MHRGVGWRMMRHEITENCFLCLTRSPKIKLNPSNVGYFGSSGIKIAAPSNFCTMLSALLSSWSSRTSLYTSVLRQSVIFAGQRDTELVTDEYVSLCCRCRRCLTLESPSSQWMHSCCLVSHCSCRVRISECLCVRERERESLRGKERDRERGWKNGGEERGGLIFNL